MTIIQHRINELNKLKSVDERYGCEIDLRSIDNKIVLSHEPFTDGCEFETWIERYHHSTLILNVKEDGLEQRIMNILAEYHKTDFFFLDQTTPATISMVRNGFSQFAIRVSEYETIQSAMKFVGKADWVWIDSFYPFSHNLDDLVTLSDNGFKLCIVSPELQSRPHEHEIFEIRRLTKKYSLVVDAVCTKYPALWEDYQ